MLDGSFYAGFDASGEYRGVLRANVGYTHTETVSTGIERVDGTTVRVGDSELVEHPAGGSVGVDNLKGELDISKSYEDGKLRTIDLDITTPEGRVAYERFLATGVLPPGGTPGTSNETVTNVVDASANTELGVDLGPWEPTLLSSSGSLDASSTVHADGHTSIATTHTSGDATTDYAAEYGADGELMETYLGHRTGDSDVDVADDADVRVTFSDDELHAIREQTLQKHALREGDVTEEEVDELVQQTTEEDQSSLTGGLSQSVDEVDLAIMRADTAADVHAALLNDADGNPHVLLEKLTELGVHADQYGSDTTVADALNDTATVDVE
ncbi:MAG: hypothetical protein GEV07_07960 [Streptosporangiales bacterium]|nr:hypothetical protein [Streptosporangiales bacterium]